MSNVANQFVDGNDQSWGRNHSLQVQPLSLSESLTQSVSTHSVSTGYSLSQTVTLTHVTRSLSD